MTNSIALFLAVLLLGGIAYDWIWQDARHLLFLARRGVDLIETIAVWR